MEQNRNMEQCGTAAAVPTEKKNENRKREVSGKDAQIIRAFLENVGIYEADALRVSIAIADGKVSADTFQRMTALRSTAISTATRTTTA